MRIQEKSIAFCRVILSIKHNRVVIKLCQHSDIREEVFILELDEIMVELRLKILVKSRAFIK